MHMARALELSRRLSRPVRVGALAVAVGLAIQAPSVSATSAPAARTSAAVKRVEVKPDLPTRFQISSFNVLGYGHTAPGGDRKGWASGIVRMGWAVRLIQANSLDVIGFQEFQRPQYTRFMELVGSDFGIYPGAQLTNAAMANSIAWRKSQWTLVEANTMQVPYFHGGLIRMPYVLLRNVETGRTAYFYNSHNPADAQGPAQKWRNQAVRLEMALVKRLRTASPGTPVFITGDKNDQSEYFCPMATTEMHSADGGALVNGKCVPPKPTKIDWIMGSREVAFTAYRALRTALVMKTTDHPVVISDAIIPTEPVASSPIKRVVVISVEGLRSSALQKLGTAGTPAIQGLLERGASTLNARTAYESTKGLPNDVSMLTGRRVSPALGGHGVRSNAGTYATVHAAAGGYVASVFDVLRDAGRSSAVFTSKPGLDLLSRTWNQQNGASDHFLPDYGRNKINTFVRSNDDRGVAREVRTALSTRPAVFTFAELSAPAVAGRTSGWRSTAYYNAVRAADVKVKRILFTINNSAALKDQTLVVLTSSSGSGFGHESADHVGNYRIPMVVLGPGVPAGADLYALNPQFTSPGTAQTAYDGPQPIRNGFVANLVTSQLRLPPVPGSTLNAFQSFTVLVR